MKTVVFMVPCISHHGPGPTSQFMALVATGQIKVQNTDQDLVEFDVPDGYWQLFQEFIKEIKLGHISSTRERK